MVSLKTARQAAEDALTTIGAFPASMPQADIGELRKALNWLEMLLNSRVGARPVAGFWRIIEIPLEADVGDYLLSDYDDNAGTQQIFGVGIVSGTGSVDHLPLIWENESLYENLEDTGTPCRVVATRDASPVLKVYPTPTQSNEDAGMVLRVRIQTFHTEIDKSGNADNDLLLRPSWYLWLNDRLSYEIGKGPVRRLPEGELKRLQDDARTLEIELLARDGQYNSGKPPVTEPMAGWDADNEYHGGSRSGYTPNGSR